MKLGKPFSEGGGGGSRENIIGQLIPCVEDEVREGTLDEIWNVGWERFGELLKVTSKGLVLTSGSWCRTWDGSWEGDHGSEQRWSLHTETCRGGRDHISSDVET